MQISQPSYIHPALDNTRMTAANGKDTPHASGVKYHAAAFDDKPVPHLADMFKTFWGNCDTSQTVHARISTSTSTRSQARYINPHDGAG